MELLSFGDSVKVIEPNSLKNKSIKMQFLNTTSYFLQLE